ncbi:MAG: restriction endonuclease subunit S [Lachnospiraceae bacterium]|nr:restriction endonuclease subunit S [Lachnospiraceae bacterium]
MVDWEEQEFEKLYKIPSRNGLSKPSKVRGSGFKMINMGELFANDRIYDIPMELVPCNEKEQENAKVEKRDLLFARQSLVEAGAGKCSIVMEVSDLTVFESHIIRVRLNEEIANPMFYYYYFKSGMSQMRSIVQHSVQAGIKASDLAKLPVVVPPIDIQNRIADFISLIDTKIETNNQINRNLCEQAA